MLLMRDTVGRGVLINLKPVGFIVVKVYRTF